MHFSLRLDGGGWVDLQQLVLALKIRPLWEDLSEAEVLALVEQQTVFRFETDGQRIRALYGHSVQGVTPGEFATPPPFLYHATRASAFASIQEKGLAAGKRSYAHLTSSLEYAQSLKQGYDLAGLTGLILIIDTAKVLRSATPFFKASDVVWTSPYISPPAISLLLEPSNPQTLILPIGLNTDSIAISDQHVASSLSQLKVDADDE